MHEIQGYAARGGALRALEDVGDEPRLGGVVEGRDGEAEFAGKTDDVVKVNFFVAMVCNLSDWASERLNETE